MPQYSGTERTPLLPCPHHTGDGEGCTNPASGSPSVSFSLHLMVRGSRMWPLEASGVLSHDRASAGWAGFALCLSCPTLGLGSFRWAHTSPGEPELALSCLVSSAEPEPLEAWLSQTDPRTAPLTLTKVIPRTEGNEQAHGWCTFFTRSDSQQTKMLQLNLDFMLIHIL